MAPSPPNLNEDEEEIALITVKCTKSCLWAIHHAWGPQFQIEDGMVLGAEFPKDTNAADWGAFKVKLIDSGHAELVPNEEPEESEGSGDSDADSTTGSDDEGQDSGGTEEDAITEVTPQTLKAELAEVAFVAAEGLMGSEKKAKAALEAIGKERYGYDVDKRMTVDKIIDAIVEAAFKKDE